MRVVKAWVGATSTHDDLRRRDRGSALRRLDRRDDDRRQRFLHVPALDTRHGRRNADTGRLRGHDPVRRRGLRSRTRAAPFAVTSPAVGGATITCTITNTQLLSSVRVVKEWVGAPSTTTIFVDATGAAPFDASTIADSSGDSASFTYPISTPVTVGEVVPVPAGYAATIQCGTGGTPVAYTGGPFPVTSPAVDGATIYLHDRQYPAALEGPSNQELVRYADQRNDLRGPGRRGAVRRFHGRDRGRGQHVLHLPGLHAGVRRRDRRAGRVHRDDPVRRRRSAAYLGGPFAVTSPATNGATLTCTISNNMIPPPATVRVVKEWIGAPSSATIFVDQDGVAPFDASVVAIADGDNTSFDYTAGTAVTVGETAVPSRIRRDDPVRRRPGPAIPGRAVRSRRPGGRRNPHMHDHEQAAALDRPRGQAVGRRPLVGGDLRRRHRRGTVRRLHDSDHERRHHVLRLPGLDAGLRRRDHGAGRVPGDDLVRRAAGSPGVQRRPVPGHVSGAAPRSRHLHDHEHAARSRSSGPSSSGSALRRPRRSSST